MHALEWEAAPDAAHDNARLGESEMQRPPGKGGRYEESANGFDSAGPAVMPQPGRCDAAVFATLQAKLAIVGVTLLRRHDGAGFVVGRWGWSCEFPDVDGVAQFTARATP